MSAVLVLPRGLTPGWPLLSPPRPGPNLEALESTHLHLDVASHSACIIVGDFNIDLLKPFDHLSQDLVGLTSAFGLSKVIKEATWCIPFPPVASLTSSSPASGNILIGGPLGMSDHSSIQFDMCFEVRRCSKRRIWLYKRADFEGLNNALQDTLDGSVRQGSDVDVMWLERRGSLCVCPTSSPISWLHAEGSYHGEGEVADVQASCMQHTSKPSHRILLKGGTSLGN